MKRKGTKIEKYRPTNGHKTITPAAFKKMLTELCTPQTMKDLTNVEIGNLIHYLVFEELGQVSFDKLSRALR